jgi:hypothetical protein
MRHRFLFAYVALALLGIFLQATAQTTTLKSYPNASPVATQSVASTLAALPDADTLIYINPRRILNDAAPRVVAAAEVAKMRATFDDLKKGLGVDPSTIDHVVIAVRFNKPSGDLNFVPPDVLAIATGDFSADSLMTIARLQLQDEARDEKYGTRSLAVTKIDPIAKAAEKNPLFKSFSEIAFAPLNTNTLVIGNVSYVKAAMDAADGTGRIQNNAISSLLRDPNALISVAGSPLTAFAKSFGLLGTQTTPRDPRCETAFGNFYAAITMEGNSFNVRGAMNADNPDTAQILHGLLSGLLQQAISSVPDKSTQNVLNALNLLRSEREVVISAAIPQSTVAEMIREQSKPTLITVTSTAPQKKPAVRKRTRPRRR